MDKNTFFEIKRRTFLKWSSAISALATLPINKGLIAKENVLP